MVRIDENASNGSRINFAGYYDRYEERSDVYRKCKAGITTETQEYCEGHCIAYEQ